MRSHNEFGVDISTVSLIGKRNGLSRKQAKALNKYRGIGFTPEMESAVSSFAVKNRIGFGEAVRRLINASLGAAND